MGIHVYAWVGAGPCGDELDDDQAHRVDQVEVASHQRGLLAHELKAGQDLLLLLRPFQVQRRHDLFQRVDHGLVERAGGQSAENDLDETLAGLLSDLNAADLSLKDPDGTWLTYAFSYATGHTELPKGDLQALRAALTWHTAGSRDIEYWREISMNGQLLTLLRGFEDFLNIHEQRGLATDRGERLIDQ